jgi:protoheme ferro-lyase
MTLPLPASLVRDEPAFQHGSRLRVGVLLVNLGTPDAADGPALRRYLKEFLSDPRVVEIPKLVWWPILNLIILNTRPAKSARKYASVWTDDPAGIYFCTSTALSHIILRRFSTVNTSRITRRLLR